MLKYSISKTRLHIYLILRMPLLPARIVEIMRSLINLTFVRFFRLFSSGMRADNIKTLESNLLGHDKGTYNTLTLIIAGTSGWSDMIFEMYMSLNSITSLPKINIFIAKKTEKL